MNNSESFLHFTHFYHFFLFNTLKNSYFFYILHTRLFYGLYLSHSWNFFETHQSTRNFHQLCQNFTMSLNFVYVDTYSWKSKELFCAARCHGNPKNCLICALYVVMHGNPRNCFVLYVVLEIKGSFLCCISDGNPS